jgi:hypothetical protein
MLGAFIHRWLRDHGYQRVMQLPIAAGIGLVWISW